MAFCEVESEIDREFDLGVPSDDGFPMNLMSNENITWTVERERGISFDLTALTDPDLKYQGINGGGGGMPLTPDAGAALLDVMRREVKLETESGVKESTFGHPFGGQCRPQPRPAPPSPFSRGGGGGGGAMGPNKRTLPPSFELRESCSAKRQWDPTPPPQQQQQPTRTLGRTRSRSMRPSAAKAAAATAAAAPTTATPGRSRSGGGGGRAKAEAAGEGRGSGTAGALPPRRRHVGGVDTVALAAELGLVDSRRYGGGAGRRGKGGAPYRVGAYTLEERAALVARFHAKRGRRIWRKKIKYDCRKKLADKRPRLKGRFVTQEELEGLDQETLAKVTGLGPWPEDEDEDEAEARGEAGSLSDSSDGDGGSPAARPTATRCRSGGAGKSSRRRNTTGKAGSPRNSKKARCGGASKAAAAAAAAAAVAAAAAAAAAVAVTSMDEDEEEEEEELDLDDDDGDSSTSAASEDSVGGEEGGGTMTTVSSSCKVSAMFAVKTEADVDMPDHQDHQTTDLIEPQQLVVEEEEEDYENDNAVVDTEDYEPTDPVFGFMIDDILSSNFNVVPSLDSSSAAGVAVN